MSHIIDRFDSATIEILTIAIDDAWREIERGDSPLKRPAYARIVRALIAKRIIELAKSGERNRHKLSKYGILAVAANQKHKSL
jgi:hypothetical protein